jgi:signal transduction histidine kinase
MTPIFYRPVKLRGLAFLGLLVLALGILSGMMWWNLHRFESVLSYVNYSHRIQNLSISLQQSLIEHLTESSSKFPTSAFADTILEMEALTSDKSHLSKNIRKSLQTVNQLLADIETLDKLEKNTRLIRALEVMSKNLDDEAIQREDLLQDISKTTETELFITLVIFTVIILLAFFFLRYRILHPLHDLRRLLERLTEENFTPFTTEHLDPLLMPVFNSYNDMVKRLAELEEAKRLHAQSLQYEVRLATHALLEQQASLARAERLAAVGEVAAELAHEIRNPLAGIQMAFANFHREIEEPEQLERLEMINAELKRVAVLLNDMLDQSRHHPEVAVDFNIAILLRDLVSLTRYQIHPEISLEIKADPELIVHLPESMVRQALLNLLLNAADAIGQKAGLCVLAVTSNAQELIISVSDDGIGFPQEMLEYGIRPFRSSRQRGTGIGLAMVQRFVKSIGGRLKLSNQSSQGATVSLILPSECLVSSSTL